MKINQARRARFELAIALTLFFALCYAAGCDRAQQALADDILRLRVVAHSDTADDQAVKLRVRDGVLAGCISIPTRYIHSPVETADLADYEAAVQLVCAAVAKKELPHR